jgi:tetratricopeptide (TPR) repeat protein
VGDRAGEGGAYGNLGNAYRSQGDVTKAIEYHTQHLAIAKEVGDRAGEGITYGNIGCAYRSQGDFGKAIEYHTQDLAIAKEVGDRAGEGTAYRNLGTCHMHLNEYVKAVAYFEAQHGMATSLKLAHVKSEAAPNMGVALTLGVHAARQGPVAGADQAPGPHSHSSSSACLDDRVREAAKWLQAAFDGGRPFAKLPGAPHLHCGPRGRGAGTSQRAPLMALATGTLHLRRVLADAGRGHADAHVQRLPCSEVLLRRSPKDGFEKTRIGREPDDRAAQGHLRST